MGTLGLMVTVIPFKLLYLGWKKQQLILPTVCCVNGRGANPPVTYQRLETKNASEDFEQFWQVLKAEQNSQKKEK